LCFNVRLWFSICASAFHRNITSTCPYLIQSEYEAFCAWNFDSLPNPFSPCIGVIGSSLYQHFVNACIADGCAGAIPPDDIQFAMEPLLVYCQLNAAWSPVEGECTDEIFPWDALIGGRCSACSACSSTCVDPQAEQHCSLSNSYERYRRCPTGQLLFDGMCVSRCGCVDGNDVAHQVHR